MKELRSNVSFTQLRFYCSKQQGRTFHVTTAANSSDEAVVQYFSGQTDVRPDACGSFVRMEDDNSAMAKVCKKWGGTKSLDHFTNKWSLDDQNYEKRLYDHVVLVWYKQHWPLIELSDGKLSDNNLTSELVENRSFLNQSKSRKL